MAVLLRSFAKKCSPDGETLFRVIHYATRRPGALPLANRDRRVESGTNSTIKIVHLMVNDFYWRDIESDFRTINQYNDV